MHVDSRRRENASASAYDYTNNITIVSHNSYMFCMSYSLLFV